MNNKKLCLVIPSLQAGGMERVMSELAWHFSVKEDIELHMMLYGRKPEIFYSLPSKIVVHKPAFLFKNNYRLYSTLRTLFYVRKTIKTIKPDAILSFGAYWNSFVLLSALGLKLPVFVSDRSQPDKKLRFPHEYIRKCLYHKSRGVIAQTIKAKEIYYSKYKHPNIKIIGNPIREFDPDKIKSQKKENIVLSVGRYIKTKHHDRLIKIFVKINEPGWKLVIVGYDHLKQQNMARLNKLVKELKAEKKVILTGKQNNIDEYYLKSRLFAFTSSSEGFPNAIGEALSAGLPVVAYDCIAGPSEMIINNKNGYLVNLFDDNEFENKLRLLMKDRKLREKFSTNAQSIIKRFNIQEIGESYFRFITSSSK